jgi:hypothetical protein
MIERIGAGTPACWAPNHENTLAAVKSWGDDCHGAAIHARRRWWRLKWQWHGGWLQAVQAGARLVSQPPTPRLEPLPMIPVSLHEPQFCSVHNCSQTRGDIRPDWPQHTNAPKPGGAHRR